MCCAMPLPSPVWEPGGLRLDLARGGLETLTRPLARSFKNKEQLLQMLLQGISYFLSSCWFRASAKQNQGLLLLSCCGNGPGSLLQCLTFLLEASSSSGGERGGLSLEKVPHQLGLELLTLVFVLSKTTLPATSWDG